MPPQTSFVSLMTLSRPLLMILVYFSDVRISFLSTIPLLIKNGIVGLCSLRISNTNLTKDFLYWRTRKLFFGGWDELTEVKYLHAKMLYELLDYWQNVEFLTSKEALVIIWVNGKILNICRIVGYLTIFWKYKSITDFYIILVDPPKWYIGWYIIYCDRYLEQR